MVNRVICSVFMHRRPKKFPSWVSSTTGTATPIIWRVMNRVSGRNLFRIFRNMPHTSIVYGPSPAMCLTSPTRTASISRPVRATPPRRMTSTATNGATPRGWTGAKSTCRIPIRSTSTNATSARGRCTRTATSTPTASWRTSLCRMSRKWATPTSSLCR